MIAVDDMRPELGSYGCSHMHTPHLDALAAESLSFDNAYIAVAWCSPSRTVRYRWLPNIEETVILVRNCNR